MWNFLHTKRMLYSWAVAPSESPRFAFERFQVQSPASVWGVLTPLRFFTSPASRALTGDSTCLSACQACAAVNCSAEALPLRNDSLCHVFVFEAKHIFLFSTSASKLLEIGDHSGGTLLMKGGIFHLKYVRCVYAWINKKVCLCLGKSFFNMFQHWLENAICFDPSVHLYVLEC